MCKKIILQFIFITLTIFSFSALADKKTQDQIRVLEEKLIVMETEQQQLKNELSAITSSGEVAQDLALDLEKKIHSQMKISGYADIEYIDSGLDNFKPGFRLHHFSLFFTKEIDKNWRIFSELEFEDGPFISHEGDAGECEENCSGTIFLEAMNIDYLYAAGLNIKAGRFFTPAGIWSENHYPPFVPTQERPMHIRKIFPQLVDGLMSFGKVKIGESFLKYSAYLGNGEGNNGKSDSNTSKAAGVKVDILLPYLSTFELGVTTYEDTLNNDTEKSVIGGHASLQFWSFFLQMEYASGDYKPLTGIDYTNEGYYAQLMHKFNDFGIGYRYDYFDKYDNNTLTEIDEIRESVLINWYMQQDVTLKFEYHMIDPELDDAYWKSITSIVVNLISR